MQISKAIKRVEDKYLKMYMNNKRGQMGGLIGLPGAVVIGLLILVVIVIAMFLAFNSLTGSGIFAAGSQSYNDTLNITETTTTGVKAFWQNVPTVFTILGVVLILGALGLLIVLVIGWARMQGGSRGFA